MSIFNVGDKVRRTAPSHKYDTVYVVNGNIYTIEKVGTNSIKVKEDDVHTYDEQYFELVESVPMFMVGDIVEAFGVRGVVETLKNSNVGVRFFDNNFQVFYFDGKAAQWHKTPSLKFIERPLKEVTFNARVYAGGLNTGMLENISELKTFVGKNVEVTVKVKE